MTFHHSVASDSSSFNSSIGGNPPHHGRTVLVASILSSDHTTALTEAVDITTVVLHTHALLQVGGRAEKVITVTGTGHTVGTTADQCTDKDHQHTTEDPLLTAASTPQRWYPQKSGQGVTTVDLLTHATTTLLDQGTMDVARVTTGADHPTTDMAATLHHVITATHTMDKGHHPTSECCLGTGVRQMQFATSKKTEKQSTG
ncbi:hypothetical protein WJX79_008813 [Trebouxia sp. C0005]